MYLKALACSQVQAIVESIFELLTIQIPHLHSTMTNRHVWNHHQFQGKEKVNVHVREIEDRRDYNKSPHIVLRDAAVSQSGFHHLCRTPAG